MRTTLALAVCLMCGCPDDPAPTQPIHEHATQAIKDWKAQGLPWVNRCSPFLVYLTPVPQDELRQICGNDVQLYACLVGLDIFIDEDVMDTVRADYVVEHELRHWLSGCQFGTVDGAHADDRIWYPYRGVNIRE